ncbi:MAG TPA: hypothetical protein VHS03_13825 [Gaiellaceae bacterium]|jgi:hypothetical protein|nr:hypothetical protein [Gaiellaceae bacterium]
MRWLSGPRLVLCALGAAAIALIVVELSMGAIDFGEAKLADPCKTQPHLSEGGLFGSIDAAIQRVALSGLNGAACSLHTSREELVLSFAPSLGTKKVRWSKATIQKALRGGIARAAGGGLIGSVVADLLADPIAYFIGQASG